MKKFYDTGVLSGTHPLHNTGVCYICIRDNPIFSSERILRKDYLKGFQLEKKSLVVGLKGFDGKMN
jgi:hypothetical protein